MLAQQDKTLSLLVSFPNVIVTSQQAFLTHGALANIATTTLKDLDDYFAGAPLENEICYRCLGSGGAKRPTARTAPMAAVMELHDRRTLWITIRLSRASKRW